MDVCEQLEKYDRDCSASPNAATPTEKSSEGDYPTEETEQLGSVTLSQESDGTPTGLQIRSSARVSKKMRLDSIPQSVPVVSVAPVSVPSASAVAVEKKAISTNVTDQSKDDDKQDGKQITEPKPKRKPSELWSPEDKNTFFEALNEYGKDFDAIQNYFAMKARKRGNPELAKNKDQARHFYYRTWHKVSKHLKFPEGIQKVTQELYALINYGEMRKKLSCITEKTSVKLNELISKGHTLIRLRGKTIRIRTPLCRALRRLNHLDELQDELKLPNRVIVELRPRDSKSWARVQSVAQNPRARTSLPLQRRLSTLVNYLQYRWRPEHLKHRDRLLSSVNAEELSQPVADYCKEEEPLLRLAPPPETVISTPSINLSEYLTSSILCLSAYEERLANWPSDPATVKTAGGAKKAAKRNTKQKDVAPVVSNAASQSEERQSAPVSNPDPAGIHDENACDVDSGHDSPAPSSPTHMAINNILSLQQEGSPLAAHSPSQPSDKSNVFTEATDADVMECSPPAEQLDNKEDLSKVIENMSEVSSQKDCNAAVGEQTESKEDSSKATIEKVREGWTQKDAHAVTIGELYLMFGSEGKIQLEYWWEESTPNVKVEPGTEVESAVHSSISAGSPVTLILQKLLSIAKLNYKKSKVACPCGHICGLPNKLPTVTKTRLPQKTRPVVTTPVDGAEQKHSTGLLVPEASVSRPHLLATTAGVTSLHDGVFRRPLLAPSRYRMLPKHGSGLVDTKPQLEKFQLRYCNRRGRSVRPKNVVVQRMLPLLPKAPSGHSVVTLNVIQQTSQLPGEFLPFTTTTPTTAVQHSTCHPVLLKPQPQQTDTVCLPDLTAATVPVTAVTTPASTADMCAALPVEPTVLSAEPTPNTDDLSGLLSLDLSTPPPTPAPVSSSSPLITIADGIDIAKNDHQLSPTTTALPNGFSDECDPTAPTGFGGGLLPSDDVLETSSTRSLPSPTRILKEDDNQWLNSEVADFSLSSFLGHLESPMKNPCVGTVVPVGEESRMSSDVEAQLQCLMSENSVDYMAKFADLAAQIASDGAVSKK
ncbi:protein cramped isoform X3 [Schistocerca cancellata]|uniref:protein cramped isoform X2 n=1 Tax=Schistocerca cancellata TaxID=274614 RepID=UPI00211793E1|nr:protein cramped isoform X2 [Schistocerca cancellata]XP_049765732.1 protein cramped isoform X3 [Schistocerca cancellata]